MAATFVIRNWRYLYNQGVAKMRFMTWHCVEFLSYFLYICGIWTSRFSLNVPNSAYKGTWGSKHLLSICQLRSLLCKGLQFLGALHTHKILPSKYLLSPSYSPTSGVLTAPLPLLSMCIKWFWENVWIPSEYQLEVAWPTTLLFFTETDVVTTKQGQILANDFIANVQLTMYMSYLPLSVSIISFSAYLFSYFGKRMWLPYRDKTIW